MSVPEIRQEHTSSYYAATANDPTRYPELTGAHSVDVCVVGAGFSGVATALTLAERGYAVALLEANRVGWGASGRNGGQLIHGFSKDYKLAQELGPGHEEIIWNMAWRGHDIIHERIERYGIECDLVPGFLEVAAKDSHMSGLEAQYQQFERFGHAWGYELLDADATAKVTGTNRYRGALLTLRNGHLQPLNLCLGEARAAASLGVSIFEQSPAEYIVYGDRPRVVTAKGHVEASHVVLAGNAYHRLEPRHLSGYVFAAGSYIIATEPLDKAMREKVNPCGYAVCDTNEIVDYYRTTVDGRMLYGGRCNYSGRDPKDITAAIKPRMLNLYPQLEDVEVEFEWGGKIGIVLNRVPMLGRIEDNVFYVQGYSGHGVNATHIMGEILADAICGTTERFDMFARIKHMRIPGSQWLGNQMLAMGMLYYRFRDWLS